MIFKINYPVCKVEDYFENRSYISEENDCEQILISTHKRDLNDPFIVHIPLKDLLTKLKDFRKQALKRFFN